MINTRDRKYQKIKRDVKGFIQKNKKNKRIDHSTILNEVNIDYDTLIQILRELKNEGQLK